MGLPKPWEFSCNISTLIYIVLQSLRRSERSGRRVRRRKRTSARPTTSVLGLLLSQPMVQTLVTVPLLPVTSRVVDPSNYPQSATSLAPKFQVNTKLLQEAFSNCKSTATTTFNTLATLHRHMAHQTRCTVNVITPSSSPPCRTMLTFIIDNGAPAPKYEH
jgi:hypothetical protein